MSFDRFFSDEALLAVGDEVVLGPEEARHLVSVYRAGPGTTVTLFDGRGGEAKAEVVEVQRRSVRLKLVELRGVDRRAKVEIELAVALPRGGAADDVLRRAMEVGADAVSPLITQRSVHRADHKDEARRRERFRRLAIASMKLSGRNSVPELRDACSLSDYVAQPWRGAEEGARFFGSTDPSAPCLSKALADRPRPQQVQLVIGPEGGFTAEEEAALRGAGFEGVAFGPLVLRVESAVAVGVGMLAAW